MRDGVSCLNELAGFDNFCSAPPNAAQRSALQHLSSSFVGAGRPPPELANSKEALRALLGSSAMYASSKAGVRPYDYDLVSWPSVGSAPVTLNSALGPADLDWFRDWQSRLLRDEKEVSSLRSELGVEEPYCDPLLVRSTQNYQRFLKRLSRAGMLRWERANGRRGELGGVLRG